MTTIYIDDTNADLLGTMKITTARNREVGGRWVAGTIGEPGQEHRFQALIFAGHADISDYEMGDSRISKLWLQRLSDRKVVANFDRGWDMRPATPLAAQVVDLLAAGLAETVFAA